jgi:hypothetical protein
MWCDYHRTHTHDNRNCRAQQSSQNTRNQGNQPSRRENVDNPPQHRYYTRSQARIANENRSNQREENHRHSEVDSHDQASTNDNDRDDLRSQSSDESFFLTTETKQSNQKKEESYIPELIIGVLTNVNPPEYKYLRALVDSGASRSILHAKSLPTEMQTIITDDEDGSITWETKGGNFKTKHIASVLFQLSELAQGKHFLHTFKIENTTKNSIYDIILGRDLFQLLKLDLIWSSTIPLIAFEGKQVEMKPRGFWTRTTIEEYSQSLTFSREKADEIATQDIFQTSEDKEIIKKGVSPQYFTKKVESPQIISVHHEKSSLGTFPTSSHATESTVINKQFSKMKKSHGREFFTQKFHHHHQNNEEIYFTQDDKHHNIKTLSESTFRSANIKKNEDVTKYDNKFLADMTDKEIISKFSTYRVKLKSPSTQSLTFSDKSHINGTVVIARGPNHTERINIRRIVPYFA